MAKAGVSRAQGQLGEAERLLREARARLHDAGLASALMIVFVWLRYRPARLPRMLLAGPE